MVADYAETADSVFANARPARDWNLSGITRIHPEVDRFEPLGPRRFRVTYAWRVNESLPRDYSCFVHFGKDRTRRSPRSCFSRTTRWPYRLHAGGRDEMLMTVPRECTFPTACGWRLSRGRSACLHLAMTD